MRFPFKKKPNENVWCQLGGLDISGLIRFMATVKDEEEMELLVRKKIRWDIEKMRKFFEGPVCKFVVNLYAERGIAYGKGVMREALKAKFIGFDKTGVIPISSTTLDFDGFKEFLVAINNWCLDEFGCPLPEADSTDIGD